MSGIRIAQSESEIGAIRLLFREYASGANAPECFVALEAELASLPGDYAPPQGRLFLAGDAVPAGCVALRRLDADSAEIKRLYVRETHRGSGLGRLLATAAIDAARASGARRVLLDTLPSMREAHALYRSLGFRETAAYLAAPTPGATCFALEL
jgi:GNAT superfamily N-acetyltransferase